MDRERQKGVSDPAEQTQRSLAERLKDQMKAQAVRAAKEIGETLTDKVIPHGAAELGQALFSESNAYVPYGPSQGPFPTAPSYGPAQGKTPTDPHPKSKGMEI